MKIVLQMTIGGRRAFRSEAIVPNSIIDHKKMLAISVDTCCGLAEEQIKEIRELVGGMIIGRAPTVTHDFHLNGNNDKKNPKESK